MVEAPAGGDPRRLRGSPFPLDAALHVACAWCQRYGDTVALPVGFGSRRIVQPIVPGESCRARIAAKGLSEGAFLFDILILGSDERLREELSGVRMRDVSQGRLRPPDWIRVGKQGPLKTRRREMGTPPLDFSGIERYKETDGVNGTPALPAERIFTAVPMDPDFRKVL